MSNAPWTPGPWVATPSGRIMGTVYSQSWAIAERGQANLIAGCFSDVRDGLAKANARLIAEAPAMAEALADMVDALSFVERHYNTRINPPTLDQARAILARINGGTP